MSPSNKPAYLSKSLYMRGLQCHKSLFAVRRTGHHRHRIDAGREEACHFEYLARPGVDPRVEIAEKLLGEIPEGAMASEAYFAMETIADPAELSRLRKALLEYCKQDTLGLVRLLEKMRSIEATDPS